MKATLVKTVENFPFKWANLDNYRKSVAHRKEVYLKNENCVIEGLTTLFYSLFEQRENSLLIYNKSWWDFCLDTWDFDKDEYDYGLKGKSPETQLYLKMLKESEIELNYSGCCKCRDWRRFLKIILACISTRLAPYSPIFCDIENEYFFYFHHTGSIGIYYKNENTQMKGIFSKAYHEFLVED